MSHLSICDGMRIYFTCYKWLLICLLKGRLSKGPHEIQGCCSQKCSQVTWGVVGDEIHSIGGWWNPHSWCGWEGCGVVGDSGVSGWDNRCYSYPSLMQNYANHCNRLWVFLSILWGRVRLGWVSQVFWLDFQQLNSMDLYCSLIHKEFNQRSILILAKSL